MKAILSIVLAMVASFAWGGQRLPLGQPLMETEKTTQASQLTTAKTSTMTEADGVITKYTPGSAVVLRESNGPVRYQIDRNVTYANRSGRILNETTAREKIRVGVPVRVEYTGTGSNRVVDRFVLEED